MEKVSVVITCFNNESTISKTIKSVLKQTYSNIEIIIINDGSTDNSSNVIKQYANKYKNITFFDEKENKGILYSRNMGIEVAKGEYILILDADKTIKKEYVRKAVTIFENDSEISIVYFKKQKMGNSKIIPNNFDNTIEVLLYMGYIYSGCIFRRENYCQKGGKSYYLKNNLIDYFFKFKKSERYDLIFSFGEVCFCSTILRKCYLQNTSYPFDWNGAIDFKKKCKILANKCYRFFEKEDLQSIQEYINEERYAFRNTFNDMVFNHDFPKNLSFDESYKIAKIKYDRRVNRLLNNIENAKSVLAVFMEIPESSHAFLSDKEIIEGHKILQKTFGEKFNTLYIRNSFEENKKIKLADGLTKIVCNYSCPTDKTGLYPNQNVLKNLMLNYKTNIPITYTVKIKTLKFFLNFIPSKTKKKKIRNKFHIY